MNNKEIDVFIISYNRLSYLKSLVAWLEKAGFEKIHIVDNASIYPPLLEYLESTKHKVHRMDRNYGHLVAWECEKFKDIIDNKNYIVSDCDVLPIEACPLNVTEYFAGILEKYPSITKVGFALKIDDLPDYYAQKQQVLDWEGQFWKKEIVKGLYDASIDTTFALYRPGIYPNQKKWWKSIRTGAPYVARHLPWYEDLDNPNEEELFYQRSLNNQSSFWSANDLELLKEYNKQLSKELEEIYVTRKWKILQIVYKICNFFISSERFSKKNGRKSTVTVENIIDVKALQKINRELAIEVGSIKNSGGWKLMTNMEKFLE